MTLSILTFDPTSGIFAAAAATGSLCVGGWVLRGDIESGVVASQGTAPSTFWRDDALRGLYRGGTAQSVIDELIAQDKGRDHRQISAIDRNGLAHAFTGAQSVPFAGHKVAQNIVISGNMLQGAAVLEAMEASLLNAPQDPARKMIHVLTAAQEAGGDSRGLRSAALLILKPAHPPLDIRIDDDDRPIDALEILRQKTHSSPYCDWLEDVPVLVEKSRHPQIKQS